MAWRAVSLFPKNNKQTEILRGSQLLFVVRDKMFNRKMTKPQLWQLGVLIFASIASSRCSILSRSLECPLQGSTFGGRLILMDGGGLGSGLFPSFAHRGRMIIFQTPPAHLTSHMGFGRGQIWMGSRSCPGSGSQLPEQCPWTGDRPCIDAGIPCETEPPSYGQSNPLDFPEVAEDSITVSWPAWDETTDIGLGPVTGYKILYREMDGIFEEILVDGNRFSHRFDNLTAGTIYQFRVVLVRDGQPTEGPPSEIQDMKTLCRELGHVDLNITTLALPDAINSRLVVSWQPPSLTANCHVTHQQLIIHQLDKDGGCEMVPSHEAEHREVTIEPEKQTRSFKRLPANSKFNITYRATNPRGTYVTWQLKRTAMTKPTGEPTKLRFTSKLDTVDLFWDAPSCGKRNGEIIHYKHITTNGEIGSTKPGRQPYTIRDLSSGVGWTFKVQACTEAGCGPNATLSRQLD
ncbi:hypothetical protein HOLleu_29457 [Holothuria leucospilota]|uniref:Fibronectin type-III domain-containing protein n=1 Tax=Holothuria leucospilota TaxID=206669 RepID=A0A9Q1H2A1_HOLLE|nr:hypothetical protein HOLleu_29457 [Holothuria leucospilota]